MSDHGNSLRESVERVGEYDGKPGYRYTIRAAFDEQKRPVLTIESGGSTVEIDASDWSCVHDAADRALEFIGGHPDAKE